MLGRLFIICGPPGVGKGTVTRLLISDVSLPLVRAISWTTRAQCPGETNGVDYHFVTDECFSMAKEAGLLFGGTKPQFGFWYGVPLESIEAPRRTGRHVLMESNLIGVRLAKKQFVGVCSVFLAPPSIETLRERLRARQRDNEEETERRLRCGLEMMAIVDECEIDHLVVNDELASCLRQLQAILVHEIGL